jgi:AcrR family transcriptional regulator
MPKIIATKEDWIKEGYYQFAASGVKGIVVEQLAARLKVNKSGFYWHFKTKKAFIKEIVAFWVALDTNQIIVTVEKEGLPKKKFIKLVEIVFKKEPHLDFIFFLKRYALKHKEIQSLLDKIDNQRIKYTKDLLLAMGFSKSEAMMKSKLFYKYLIGYHEMIRYKKQSKNYIKEVKKELNQFIKV